MNELNETKEKLFSTEKQLNLSEDKFNLLFDNLGDEVHLWKLIKDEKGEIKTWELVDANPAALKSWKKKKKQVVGKTTNEIFGHNASLQFMPIVKKIFTSGKTHKWVEYFKPTNRYLSMSSIPMGDYFLSTGKDITQDKIAQKKLEESEQKFKSIFKDSTVAKIIADENGKYIDANIKACELLGYSYEELTSLDVLQIVYRQPQDIRKNYESFKEKGAESGEITVVRKDGELRTVEYYAKEISENRYLSTLIDITERKRHEQEKRNAQLQLLQVTNSIPGAIYQFKFQEDGSLSMPYISAKANELLGFSYDKMKNVEFLLSRIYPEDYDRIYQSIIEANKHDVMWSVEFRALNYENEITWIKGHSYGAKDNNGDVVHNGVFIDITEKKQVEEALIISEKLNRNIAENLPGIVLQYKLKPDGSDELLYISNAVKDLYEVSKEEALANNQLLWDRVYKEDLKHYISTIKESAQNLSVWEYEHRLQFSDGRVKWVFMKGTPYKQDDGSVIWDSIGLDITKRKEAELELERINHNLEEVVEERAKKAIELSKELELYWLAAEHAKSGVWRYDLRTNALEWDNIMYDLYGINKKEFSGAYDAWESSLHPNDKEHAISALNKTISEKVDFDTSFRLLNKNTGKITHIRGKGKVEVNENGETVAIYGTNWDVTREMKLVEEREDIIRELEIYQMASKNAEVGVWILNPITKSSKWDNTLLNIYELKPGFYEDNIIPFERYIGMIHEEDREKVKSELQKTLQTGNPMNFMFRIATAKTKTPKFIRTKGKAYLDDSGQVSSIYGTNWDITKEMKLAEEKEAVIKELTRANDELKTFNYMITHDLRTPLRAIGIFTNLLQKKLKKSTDNDIEEYINYIHTSREEMNTLISDLLSYSRLREEKREVYDTLIQSAITNTFNENKILNPKMKASLDIDKIPVMKLDITLFKHVISNLIGNSFKYSSPERDLKIKVRYESTKKKHRLIFIDNGLGFNNKFAKSIFKTFNRLVSKDHSTGSGLGLSICSRIVEIHNGKIWAESEQNVGSKFFIEIPKGI